MSKNLDNFYANKRLHLDLFPTLWEDFRLHLVSAPLWRSQCGRQNQKFAVRWCSNFFSNFDYFHSPFNPVFYLELKNIKIFKIEPKLTFLHDVFSWNYVFGGKILIFFSRNVKRMWEVFRVHLDLSLTMWAELCPHCGSQCGPECEKFVSLNEDA